MNRQLSANIKKSLPTFLTLKAAAAINALFWLPTDT